MNRRAFLEACAAAAVASAAPACRRAPVPTGETLYNGIVLPSPWPQGRPLDREVIVPPYLKTPPGVIPIDVGRQLFVDDFLIESTTLTRMIHTPTSHPENPILKPDRRWERVEKGPQAPTPTAMVFSDGVVYESESRLFRMWYMGGYSSFTCMATSLDGVHWTKPVLDVVKGTNIAFPPTVRDSSTIWVDRTTTDVRQRYKLALSQGNSATTLMPVLSLYTSPDGVHWTNVGESGTAVDRSTFFYNPFRDVWVFSIRDAKSDLGGRYRRYFECRDFASAKWSPEQAVVWAVADRRDLMRPDLLIEPELYNLDCVAYESVMLGLFSIFRGDRPEQKVNEVCVGFSRDGFHFHRPDRRAFIGVSEDPDVWNHGNVQSAGGCCLVVGDELFFYVSGRRGEVASRHDSMCSTGLFTLRRDGFVSMGTQHAGVNEGSTVGTLTTRPIRFSGRFLFVNADIQSGGELRVEVLDDHGMPIEGFDRGRSMPVTGNGTKLPVVWSDGRDLSAFAGRTVKLRFALAKGQLYAFWVSASTRGESGGYLGAGAPGHAGVLDA